MKSSSVILLSFIVALAVGFRFLRNDILQFWSDDEEIHAAVVQRMIVTKRPTLVSPQPTLGTSIGSFFHIASVPLFLISKMDPEKILSLFSLIGLLTTLAIYVLGKEIAGKKLGIVASFLYATSFLAGLYDRRWWPITLTPLLSAIGLVAALRLVKTRNPRYLYLLVGVTTTALHGDPAMLLIGLFTLVLIVVYRIWLPVQAWVISAVIVIVAVSPLALFEFRHPGTIVKPLIETLQRGQERKEEVKRQQTESIPVFSYALSLTSNTVRLLILPEPTRQAESLLYPSVIIPSEVLSATEFIIVSFAFGYFAFHAFRSKTHHPEVFILFIYVVSFFVGIFLFTTIYYHPTQRVYVTLIFPVVFLIAAWFLVRFVKHKTLFLAALLLFLALNSRALFRSRYTYPLSTRQQVVKTAINALAGKDFSLYVVGDPYLESGGFTRLFIMSGVIPKKSFTDKTLGWWYRTHSLYLTTPTDEDQDRVVIITPSIASTVFSDHVLLDQQIDTLRILILNNEMRWFREDYLKREINSK